VSGYADSPMSTATSLRPRELSQAVAAVFVGGAVGTAMRDIILRFQAAPATHASWSAHIPWLLLAINAIGVFVATVLLSGPLRTQSPVGYLRLLLITGVLGGLTSYSSLFVAAGAMWHLSAVGAIGAVLGAVLSGVVAAWLGLRVAR